MLGLYIPGGSGHKEEVNNPDDEEDAEQIVDESEGRRKNSWMRPLLLCAQTSSITTATSDFPPAFPSTSLQVNSGDISVPITLSAGNFRIDVPGWIEMTNRTNRRRQLLYIVRISLGQVAGQGMADVTSEGASDEENATIAISRLRTGDELAELIQLGRDLKRNISFRLSRERSSSSDGLTPSR